MQHVGQISEPLRPALSAECLQIMTQSGLFPHHALMVSCSQQVAHGSCLRCPVSLKKLLQLVWSTFLRQSALAGCQFRWRQSTYTH